MIDLAAMRQDPDSVKKSQAARGESVELVDQVLAADANRRTAVGEFETLRASQKAIGAQVAKASGEEKQGLLVQTKTMSDQVKAAESSLREMDTALEDLILGLSNVVDPAAPVGGEEDFVVIKEVGTKRDFAAEGITVRDHVELGEELKLIDLERGAKVSGSRFYYLVGDGALLELALVNFAIDIAQNHGFTPVIPPALVKPAAMEGTGFLGQAAENVYRVEQDDLYLVGTSEVPLAAMHMDEILNNKELPIKYAGYSPCYRREAGSHGKDTRGIFRVHWFDKVEMFIFANIEDADKIHKELLEIEKEILTKLELPFRVIDVATGDLGSSASRKFDCEAWIPSSNEYRELTSTSNCTEFQARRLKIRTRAGDKTNYVATLNGTLLAVTRTIVALLENHQQEDSSINIPEALRPYLRNRESFN